MMIAYDDNPDKMLLWVLRQETASLKSSMWPFIASVLLSGRTVCFAYLIKGSAGTAKAKNTQQKELHIGSRQA